MRQVPILAEGERLRSEPGTLTVSLLRGEHIQLSFFGARKIGRVGEPEQAPDNGIWVPSLRDLATTKMAVVQQRTEKKDYLDIAAIIKSGIALDQALGAAEAVYGRQFNAAITLEALTCFQDGDLPIVRRLSHTFSPI